jgi:hypothetical protein
MARIGAARRATSSPVGVSAKARVDRSTSWQSSAVASSLIAEDHVECETRQSSAAVEKE